SDQWLVVRSNRSRYKLPIIGADAFPDEAWDEADEIDLDPEALAIAIERVLPFASRNDSRPILNMVCIEQGYVVASNGWGMARNELDYSGQPFQIHGADADLVRKHLKADSQLLAGKVGESPKRLVIRNADDELCLSFHGNPTPRWDQVAAPAEKHKFIEVAADSFADACRRCLAAAEAVEKSKYPGIGLTIVEGALQVGAIRGRQIDADAASETLDILNSSDDLNVS